LTFHKNHQPYLSYSFKIYIIHGIKILFYLQSWVFFFGGWCVLWRPSKTAVGVEMQFWDSAPIVFAHFIHHKLHDVLIWMV
jgi:hypothetical protein